MNTGSFGPARLSRSEHVRTIARCGRPELRVAIAEGALPDDHHAPALPWRINRFPHPELRTDVDPANAQTAPQSAEGPRTRVSRARGARGARAQNTQMRPPRPTAWRVSQLRFDMAGPPDPPGGAIHSKCDRELHRVLGIASMAG
jgi:hypothetical protein